MNRKLGVVPEIVKVTRYQVSVIGPAVRRICPPTAVAAAKVTCVAGVVKVLSTSDCTVTVSVGVAVPETERTCRVAYRNLPAGTAICCTAVPFPVAERAVPGLAITVHRVR